MSQDDVVIAVSHVRHRFGSAVAAGEAIADVSFTVSRGEFFMLLGPSGCGKSTLLRILAGLLTPTSGSVSFSPPELRSRCAMVFQSFALFPWLTVFENAAFGLRMRNRPEEEVRRIVEAYLSKLGLRDAANLYPKELSGGMRQRVGIARALAIDPDVLFLDEPFSQLDAFTAEELRKDLLALWEKERFTVIMVTHLIEEAVLLADRIAVMTPKPGRIETVVENTLPRPRNDRDPDFWRIEDRLTEAVRPSP